MFCHTASSEKPMQDKIRVQNWSIDVDDDDEPVVVGERGGAPFRSRPVARLDPAAGTARLVDGTILALGAPSEDVDPCDPLALPRGAVGSTAPAPRSNASREAKVPARLS